MGQCAMIKVVSSLCISSNCIMLLGLNLIHPVPNLMALIEFSCETFLDS